jgi:hypothetical protein
VLHINKGEISVSLAEVCILLGVVISFATLVLKIVELSRDK